MDDGNSQTGIRARGEPAKPVVDYGLRGCVGKSARSQPAGYATVTSGGLNYNTRGGCLIHRLYGGTPR